MRSERGASDEDEVVSHLVRKLVSKEVRDRLNCRVLTKLFRRAYEREVERGARKPWYSATGALTRSGERQARRVSARGCKMEKKPWLLQSLGEDGEVVEEKSFETEGEAFRAMCASLCEGCVSDGNNWCKDSEEYRKWCEFDSREMWAEKFRKIKV